MMMTPKIFEVATDKGPEYVAAYEVGQMMVHLRVGHKGYTISHNATGMAALPFGIDSRDAAMEVAKLLDDSADWSVLKPASYGKPEWGDMKETLRKAAVIAKERALELDCIL